MHEHTKITFKHFHVGNDPEGVIRGHNEYATRAALVDLDTGNAIEEAWCYCSPKDIPSRKKGREIAQGLLERKLRAGKWADKHGVSKWDRTPTTSSLAKFI